MLNFKKKRVKLSLIEDYLQIMLIHNFCSNSFEELKNHNDFSDKLTQIKQFETELKLVYENLFNILKMNDLSLLILKKELKENNIMFQLEKKQNFRCIIQTMRKIEFKLGQISNNLSIKLKELKIRYNQII